MVENTIRTSSFPTLTTLIFIGTDTMTAKQATKKSQELVTDLEDGSLPNRQKVSRMEKQVSLKLDEAREITVKGVSDYNAAAEFAKGIKSIEDLVHELYDVHCDTANQLHKGL